TVCGERRVGERRVGAEEREPVPLEAGTVSAGGSQGLPLEHEGGDPTDEILAAGGSVVPQGDGGHVAMVYRPDQKMVKPAQKFSKATHELLRLKSPPRAGDHRSLVRGIRR